MKEINWRNISYAPTDGTFFISFDPALIHGDFNPNGVAFTSYEDMGDPGFYGAVWNNGKDDWEQKKINPTLWHEILSLRNSNINLLEKDIPDVEPGIYFHRKSNNYYRVLFCGTFDDSVTGMRIRGVCYLRCNGDADPQFCTLERFTQLVPVGLNTEAPRFERVLR